MNYNKINNFLSNLEIDNCEKKQYVNDLNIKSTLPLENPQHEILHNNIYEKNDILQNKEQCNNKVSSYNFLDTYKFINRTFDTTNFNQNTRSNTNTINNKLNNRETLTKTI